jgi:hypothetical protein
MKLLGAGATVGTGLTAAAGRTAAATSRNGISFDVTYDAVDDLGMDPDGNTPVNDAIERAFADNALVEVPPGQYLVDAPVFAQGRAGFLGTGGSRADASFTVAPGTAGATFVFEGGEGFFENVSFDQGWNWDKLVSLIMRGGDWQFRQCDILGTEPNPAEMGDAVTSLFQSGNADGISVLLDDVRKTGPANIGDYPDGRTALIAGHGTDVTVRNCDIRNTTNGSGLYLNNTSGDVLVENNYFENCVHSAIRVNGSNATVRNNAVVVDPFGEYGNPDNRWTSTNSPKGQDAMRAVWVFDPEGRASGSPTLENNHLYHGSGDLIGCVIVDDTADGVSMSGTRVRSDPGGTLLSAAAPADVTDAALTGSGSVGGSGVVADSCVAEDVDLSLSTDSVTRASCAQPNIVRGQPPGEGGSDGDTTGSGGDSTDDTRTDLPNTLTVEGMGTETNYQFSVSDGLQANDAGGSLEEWDEISGATANGWVTDSGQVDSFEFSGEVTDFEFLTGRAAVSIDGERVDPATLGPLPHSLRVESDGGAATYELTVSGDIEGTAATESGDAHSGSTASGSVSGSDPTDAYRFSGEVTEFTFTEGSATVFVDGSEVALGADPLANTITIEGEGVATNYAFSVSGDLEANSDGDGLEEWDTLSGSSAEGWVTTTGQADSYDYSGEVTDFAFLEGSATVYVNGEESSLGGESGSDSGSDSEPDSGSESRTITIEGEGVATNYAFTVGGDLSEDASGSALESWDTVSGSSAEGWVTTTGQADSYEFTGEVTDFEFLEGAATVLVDGSEVDPATLGEPTTHTLTVEGSGVATNYAFSVSGDLAENADAGALESWDTLSGSSAEGWVTSPNQRDSFEYTGEVTDFEFLEGAATVYRDGTEVDPASEF